MSCEVTACVQAVIIYLGGLSIAYRQGLVELDIYHRALSLTTGNNQDRRNPLFIAFIEASLVAFDLVQLLLYCLLVIMAQQIHA